MKLTLGFSPCPNDTFIFDALVNKRIDTEGLEFEAILEDVETLNQWAIQGKLDITKLSFPAFFQSLDKYLLLDSGSALGEGVGPLLISNAEVRGKPFDFAQDRSEINKMKIALPGVNTTANLLFSFAFPEAYHKKFMIFSAIEGAVLNQETDLGVIIHENRFTYMQKGLHKVIDLGEYWETEMKTPIPLGGIAIRKTISKPIALKINELIRKSVDHAFQNYPAVSDYVKQHSQAMSEEVMRQHIDLYVNNYSLGLGEEGRSAIKTLFAVFNKINNQNNFGSDTSLFL